MLKPQDILVVLKLASLEGQQMSFAALAESLSMSASEVFEATRRATICRLLVEQSEISGAARFRPVATNLKEFLSAGLRYVYPGEIGKAVRGFCTAQDAAPLSAQIVRPPGELPYVWPHSEGDTRGYEIKPLYRSAPDAALHDPKLYALLALVDALRMGEARVRALAVKKLEHLLIKPAYASAG